MLLRLTVAISSLFLVLMVGCDNKPAPTGISTDPQAELLSADKAFSAKSAANGMKAAFLEYIDSNGVLLRPDIAPLEGADAVAYLAALNDSGFVYEWQPKKATVSSSRDLGFTYGTYRVSSSLPDTMLFGTYVTVWKKNAAGEWKFILDSGNEGTGETAP